MYHVYPINDEKPHDLKGTMCPCEPRVEWNDPETGEAYTEALVIHNAFDCREIVEEAERILENMKGTRCQPSGSDQNGGVNGIE
jgi:hypothetical protein